MNEPKDPSPAPLPAGWLFAGMDGGGTRTRLALVKGDGSVLGYAEGPCASFIELGTDAAARVMKDLWERAWRSSGQAPRPADSLFMGMGSILSPQDAEANRDLAASLHLAQRNNAHAANDAWNALAGGLPGRPGILLIAGTGSACLGRNEHGETWRSGGWGHLLGERGSAHALGFQALIASTRDTDGRGAPTQLTSLVRESLALREMSELYRRVHHDGVSRAEVAALAPRVLDLAAEGDAVAREIMQNGIAGLIEMVTTVARRLSLTQPELALTGGLIEQNTAYRQAFLEQLKQALPGARLAQDGLPPVFGAVLLAYERMLASEETYEPASPASSQKGIELASTSVPMVPSAPSVPRQPKATAAFLAALRRSIPSLKISP